MKMNVFPRNHRLIQLLGIHAKTNNLQQFVDRLLVLHYDKCDKW